MANGGDFDSSIVSVLEQLRLTADLDGIAVLDLSADASGAPVAYRLGDTGPDTTMLGRGLLSGCPGRPSHMTAPDGRHIMACPWVLPPARPGGLLMWRDARGRPWTADDHDLAASLSMLLSFVLGNGIGQVAIDRLTGLPNRRWFLEEAERHIDRLDRDRAFGTLFLLDIDDMRLVNQSVGRTKGDLVLLRVASELRAMIRPSDLVARVGGDEFALWQSGMDHLTAAERAESLFARRLLADAGIGTDVTFSIGIASRTPGGSEDVRALLRRAHMAAREVKTTGGGGWRVSHPEPMTR